MRSFKAVVVGDGDSAEIDAGLRQIGQLRDDDTAMLEISAIGRLPGAREDDPQWCDAYASMIDFAAQHGLVDSEQGLVQVHCERRRR